ncbi:MAG: DUF5659 domain-containing protein [Candidatus Hodarchaeales archaeon]|jgi:hypothetical protein
MKTEKNTRDIYLAAVWMALGAKFIKADRTDPKHQVFYFESDALDFEDVEKQWTNAELTVNAIQFKDAIQRMKGIIYSS